MVREICPAGIVAADGNNGLIISAMLVSHDCDVSLRVSVMFVNFSPGSSTSFHLLPPTNSSLQSEFFVKGRNFPKCSVLSMLGCLSPKKSDQYFHY